MFHGFAIIETVAMLNCYKKNTTLGECCQFLRTMEENDLAMSSNGTPLNLQTNMPMSICCYVQVYQHQGILA